MSGFGFAEEGAFGRETSNPGVTYPENDNFSKALNSRRLRDLDILRTIMGFMGVRYARYGTDSTGFDCSGFTQKILYEPSGILLPHSSRGQYAFGEQVDTSNLMFGDLLFFKLYGSYPTHVGIYIGDGLFAHASTKKGVTVSLLNSDYYKKRYFGARRILR